MRASCLYVPLLLVATAGTALAADLEPTPVEPVAPTQDWRFQATFYGWAAGLSGDVGVRGLEPQSVDVTPWEALQHLKGALMASFAAEYGNWLFLTDVMWTKIGDDRQVGRDGDQLDFVQKQLTASGLVGYRLPINAPNLDLSATAGFRYQHLNAEVELDAADPARSFDEEGTKQWIDPTIGLSLHYDINDRWFINALGDIGGFGVGSKFTSQGFATIGYNWTKTISTAIGYRVIYTDYDKDGFVFNTTEQGLFTSLGVHF